MACLSVANTCGLGCSANFSASLRRQRSQRRMQLRATAQDSSNRSSSPSKRAPEAASPPATPAPPRLSSSKLSGPSALNTGAGLAGLRQSVDNVLQRYDFLSAGLGALAVTGICVARGQDAGTALWITAASTVVALLLNDMFDDSSSC